MMLIRWSSHMCLALLSIAVLSGCQRSPAEAHDAHSAKAAASAPLAPMPTIEEKPKHSYQVREGMEYGYESALSQADKEAGAVAGRMVMFRYAGQRDGLHQIHTTDGTTMTAVECADPCAVLKVMTFVNADYLRDKVQVVRYKFDEKMLAAMAMSDALEGQLRQYGIERGGRRYQPWVTEAGYREHPWSGPK